MSPEGLAPLMPAGMGPHAHMATACSMGSPFERDQIVDDSTDFSLRTMTVFGPYVDRWIAQHENALHDCQHATRPLEDWLHNIRPPHVQQVAASRPGMMCLSSSLLRWPGRCQPCKYNEGFDSAGRIDTSHVFRQLPPPQREDPRGERMGESTKAYIAEIMQQRPPARHAGILKESLLEIEKGFATGLGTKEQLDQEYGEDNWRCTPRHLVSQENKDHVNDGLKSSQNKFTDLEEKSGHHPSTSSLLCSEGHHTGTVVS